MAATQDSAPNTLVSIAGSISEYYHARDRSTSLSGGPNLPQRNSRRVKQSHGNIVTMHDELTRSTFQDFTPAGVKAFEIESPVIIAAGTGAG